MKIRRELLAESERFLSNNLPEWGGGGYLRNRINRPIFVNYSARILAYEEITNYWNRILTNFGFRNYFDISPPQKKKKNPKISILGTDLTTPRTVYWKRAKRRVRKMIVACRSGYARHAYNRSFSPGRRESRHRHRKPVPFVNELRNIRETNREKRFDHFSRLPSYRETNRYDLTLFDEQRCSRISRVFSVFGTTSPKRATFEGFSFRVRSRAD